MLFPASCATRHGAGLRSFQIVRAVPEYLLRAPDSSDTPFSGILNKYRSLATGWVNLRPRMEVRIEAAYYREGSLKRGLTDYLGTEVARFQVRPNGRLRLISVQSGLKGPRGTQPPLQQLLRSSQRRYTHGRLFYAVPLNRAGQARGAVLLGAGSEGELDSLTRRLLADPESVCSGDSTHCTVFPEACTASLEMEIVINGAQVAVPWGNLLDSVAVHPRRVRMSRFDTGRLVPVEIDPSDPAALRLSLLPGDRITWE
jgi:hypothetical protein